MSLAPLVAIVGPTASGKTALSIALAREFGGEIVSCDSVAVYREFEIGTAKPSREERALAPHHLIDVAAPSRAFTAGDYARVARAELTAIRGRSHLPVVVGGTGLYLRALLEGLFPGPQRSEELRQRLREKVEARGPEYVHRMLRRLDAKAAASIHANDVPKVIRAIEVCLASRQPMTKLWEQGREPLEGFRTLKIGLSPDRTELYARINHRAEKMFARGLIEETRALLDRYGDRLDHGPMRSLGYRQAAQFIRGELTREEAIAAAQQGHRNYAKRQLTWFRREADVHWIITFGDSQSARAEATRLVRHFLAAQPSC